MVEKANSWQARGYKRLTGRSERPEGPVENPLKEHRRAEEGRGSDKGANKNWATGVALDFKRKTNKNSWVETRNGSKQKRVHQKVLGIGRQTGRCSINQPQVESGVLANKMEQQNDVSFPSKSTRD